MSFLSSISEMKLGKDLFVRFELPNVFEKIFSAIKQVYQSVTQIVRSFTEVENLTIRENWAYQTDTATNIAILKVERDPMAVIRTRNALKDLFE